MRVMVNTGDSLETYYEFEVVRDGVLIPVANSTGFFFPWHRVLEISGPYTQVKSALS